MTPSAPEEVFVCDEFTFELQVCNDGDEFGNEVHVVAAMADGYENAVFLLDGGGTALEQSVWLGDICEDLCKTAQFPMKCIKPGTARIEWEVFIDGALDQSGTTNIEQMCKLGAEITYPPNEASYDISDVFPVTAVITNNTDENCDVEAELFVDGPASLDEIGGLLRYPLGLITPGQSKEVNWTLHCEGEGDVDLNVVAYGSCWDDECAEPEGAYIIGIPCSFEPDGADFSPPIEGTWSYDPGDIPDDVPEENLVIAYCDEAAGEWVELGDFEVDTAGNTITAEIDHFTTFGILGFVVLPEPTPPSEPAPPSPPAPTAPQPTPPAAALPTGVNWAILGPILGVAVFLAIFLPVRLRRRRAFR